MFNKSGHFEVEKIRELYFVQLIGGLNSDNGLPAGFKTKGAASRLCGALNRAIRETLFVPKSKGRHARTKGHSFEREIAEALRPIFPEVRRHLEYQDAEANGVDLTHTGRLKIQCKRGKKWASISAIEEIEYRPELGEIAVLVTKGDQKPAMAVIPLENFIRILALLKTTPRKD